MNLLFIHQGDSGAGGGQVQMGRLQAGLRDRGHRVEILCGTRTRDDSHQIHRRPRLERWLEKATGRLGLNDIHCVSSFGVSRHPAFVAADVVDIHGTHGGFFSYLALPRLTAAKPTVFTFHDMWPLTGHCHASLDCERWKTGCGKCPYPDIYPPVRRDGTAMEWRLKKWAYARSKFTIVTPSRWLAERTRESMLGEFPVVHIPHGVDTGVYRPLEKLLCRSLLGVPDGRCVLLLVAESFDRPLKGADLLVEALRTLPGDVRRNSVLLIVGNGGERIATMTGLPAIDLGFLKSDRLKTLAFSAADLFLHPTRAESFGLVALESIACGTPVVAFRVGGIPELVRPGLSGELAEPESPREFRDAIRRLIEDDQRRSRIAGTCRELALAEYRIDGQVERYLQLYQSLAITTQN
jgi:glycosyltransferase involved in cell wall biosynthesis